MSGKRMTDQDHADWETVQVNAYPPAPPEPDTKMCERCGGYRFRDDGSCDVCNKPAPPKPKSGDIDALSIEGLQDVAKFVAANGRPALGKQLNWAATELIRLQARVAELTEDLAEYKHQYDDCDNMVATLKARVAELELEVKDWREASESIERVAKIVQP